MRWRRLRAFRQGLREEGFVEGENVAILYRFAENQMDRLPQLAADLARRGVVLSRRRARQSSGCKAHRGYIARLGTCRSHNGSTNTGSQRQHG